MNTDVEILSQEQWASSRVSDDSPTFSPKISNVNNFRRHFNGNTQEKNSKQENA